MIVKKDTSWKKTIKDCGLKEAVEKEDYKGIKDAVKVIKEEIGDDFEDLAEEFEDMPCEDCDFDYELEGEMNSCTPKSRMRAEWNALLEELYDVLDRMGVFIDSENECHPTEDSCCETELAKPSETVAEPTVQNDSIKDANLGGKILKVNQVVRLDESKFDNDAIDEAILKDKYTVEGFWYKEQLVKEDPTKDNPDVRDLSGVLIKSKSTGRTHSVNRYQLRTSDNMKDSATDYRYWAVQKEMMDYHRKEQDFKMKEWADFGDNDLECMKQYCEYCKERYGYNYCIWDSLKEKFVFGELREIRDSYVYNEKICNEIYERLLEGSNADLKMNIYDVMDEYGINVSDMRVKPEVITVEWYFGDFKAKNDIHLIESLFSIDVARLAEDIAHALYVNKVD